MSKITEKTLATERKFSTGGPRYFYEGTYTTQTEAKKKVKSLTKRGFKVITRKAKMGTRIWRA